MEEESRACMTQCTENTIENEKGKKNTLKESDRLCGRAQIEYAHGQTDPPRLQPERGSRAQQQSSERYRSPVRPRSGELTHTRKTLTRQSAQNARNRCEGLADAVFARSREEECAALRAASGCCSLAQSQTAPTDVGHESVKNEKERCD